MVMNSNLNTMYYALSTVLIFKRDENQVYKKLIFEKVYGVFLVVGV